MGSRFEKILEQLANAGKRQGYASTVSHHERKISHLEELVRAQDALGDRIVIGLGVALLVSAIALPVYAFNSSNGYEYLSNSVGWQSAASAPPTKKAVTASRSSAPDPTITGSLKTDIATSQEAERGPGANRQTQREKAAFGRYVIHQATENSALIEGPGGVWWVTPGMTVPGAGRVIFIGRSSNGWSVVTSDTTITQPSSRGASS